MVLIQFAKHSTLSTQTLSKSKYAPPVELWIKF